MALRETLNRICKMNTPTNEQATITQIIVPILIDLGWDVYDDSGREEVKPEYWVGGRKEGGKVDIALFEDNRCVCVVEAKRPGVNLIKPVDQVLRYAYYEGVTFCALTDGLEWRLYLPREDGRPEERQFVRLRLREDPVERIANDLERFLSRSTVVSGEAENDAATTLKQLREKSDIDRRLPEIWYQMLTEPDRELVTWVEKRISDMHGFRLSTEQVAKIIAATTTPSQSNYSSNPASPEVSAKQGSKRQIDYTLFGVSKPWRSGIGMWVDVVEQVYSRHERDFLEKAERLRLSPGSRRVLISGNPQSINRYKPTKAPGIYIEYSLTQAECVRLAYQLLKLFEHPPSDLSIG